MKKQIEQLRADIETLKKAHLAILTNGYASSMNAYLRDMREKLADLERKTPDTWKNAREFVGYWESHDSTKRAIHFECEIEVAKYVRYLEGKVKELESTDASNAEPLCPRRVAATAAVVMQQSMSFLIETNQTKQFPHEHAQRHADTIHLLKQSAGTEAKPYKTIAVKDLETCN